MEQRQRLIFVAAILFVGALVAFLFLSRENDHKVLSQKENELSVKLTELSRKDAEIANLEDQKKDLEEQLKSKASEMETTLKNNEKTVGSLEDRIDRTSREKETLLSANIAYENEILEIKKQSENFESERKALLKTIDQLKKDLAKARSDKEKVLSAGSASSIARMDPTTGVVDLGNIFMRRSSNSAARVESVDKLYHFIIVNAGARDGLKKDMVLNILREGRFIAKVVVQKTAENAAAAVIVPEWTREDIQADDIVSVISEDTD